MSENDQEISAMYVAAGKMLEASKLILPYNKTLGDVILSISKSVTSHLIEMKGVETDPDKSNRINKENVDKIHGELEAMIGDVKKEIEDE